MLYLLKKYTKGKQLLCTYRDGMQCCDKALKQEPGVYPPRMYIYTAELLCHGFVISASI